MRVLVVVLALGAAGCAALAHQQRVEVIGSWAGVDLVVLERHPLFAHRTPEIRQLSDGTETWIYSRCRSTTETRGAAVPVGRIAVTKHRTETREDCCYSQFFIAKAGGRRVVQEYRPVNCAVDCRAAAHGCH